MPVDEILVNDRTKAELGENGVADLQRRFGPGDCLACERPLRRAVSVVVDEFYSLTTASAYHPQCHSPAWIDSGPSFHPKGQAVTYKCRFFPGPDLLSRMPHKKIPWFLVHPSLEILGLKPAKPTGWISNDLDLYINRGFSNDVYSTPLSDVTDWVQVSLHHNRIGIATAAQHWSCRSDEETLACFKRMRGVAVAVTTFIDPSSNIDGRAIKAAVDSGECAIGWARIRKAN